MRWRTPFNSAKFRTAFASMLWLWWGQHQYTVSSFVVLKKQRPIQARLLATLIPSLSSCKNLMTPGERRVAKRLMEKLTDDTDDCICWYDVPVGPRHQHPDFVVLHPSRGVLILEVKDYRLSIIVKADKDRWEIEISKNDEDLKTTTTVTNPLEQARRYAHEVVDELKRDSQLVHPDTHPYSGNLVIPWGYGVLLPNISRKEFESSNLQHVLEPRYVLCKDEMRPSVDPNLFQKRLWAMFPYPDINIDKSGKRCALSKIQIDRLRYIMFPEVRVHQAQERAQVNIYYRKHLVRKQRVDNEEGNREQGTVFKLPDEVRVMDLQQEQLARSLGEGHRVIHGVAGSGKTMLLEFRAEYLAKQKANRNGFSNKPILVICYNEPLAKKLQTNLASKDINSFNHNDGVNVIHFHKWCREQLVAVGQPLPHSGQSEMSTGEFMDKMVNRVIECVDSGAIPLGQYGAILIDEGHDFAPKWLSLVAKMVDPVTNNLLLLYDDAQSIYDRKHEDGKNKEAFTFKSVGIQAQGRTSILKKNYRNSQQILNIASIVAGNLLKSSSDTNEDDEFYDGVPLLMPESSGRFGKEPLFINAPSTKDEIRKIAELLSEGQGSGKLQWADMAILCCNHRDMNLCSEILDQLNLPNEVRRKPGQFNPSSNTIKVLTIHACKGLEFPLVAMVGVGHMPSRGQEEAEAAKLFYVGATRAMEYLIIGVSGDGNLIHKLHLFHSKN
eukprot:scaffold72447_cov54-Attheya_sp.AAC.7